MHPATVKLTLLTILCFIGMTGFFTTGAIRSVQSATAPALRLASATATPGPCQTDVSLVVAPESITTTVGDTFIVTVTRQTSPASCFFAMYDLTLNQTGDQALFTYNSPQTVGPPVGSPVTFTLTASATGTITFTASAFGEYNSCGPTDFCWQWSSANGASRPVTVTLGARSFYLPFLQKN